MDFAGTFDTTNALSGMFLWLIFSFLSTMVNCDIQRLFRTNTLFHHTIGLVAFLFLFTLLDTSNTTSLQVILLKTVLVYALFLLMTKSKWYFVLPVLALLLVDQGFKKAVAVDRAAGKDVADKEALQKRVTAAVNVLIVVLILAGTAQYMVLQRLEYKEAFSLYKFFLGITECKREMPVYSS